MSYLWYGNQVTVDILSAGAILNVKIRDSYANVYEKILNFLVTYNLEPHKIPPTENPAKS